MSTSPPDAVGRVVAAPPLLDLAEKLRQSSAISVSGLWGSSVAAVLAVLRKQLDRPILLVCGHVDEADDLADDVELFSRTRPQVLPALELAGTLGRASEEQVSNRMRLVARYAAGTDPEVSGVLVASIQSLMQSVPSRKQLDYLIQTLRRVSPLRSKN